ncbi:family 43 glycosylhydrolase [Leifsonia aquatica]|uniref:beta-fructofuranosidase n=2 Tax=Leifsonia aquatica TaxID=144185 RepID=U2RTK2_LEIAQ|nr:family 43 glycosylhydrolase [Leifsonia aquatica]ERK72106.1 glycosyl hydrolase family 32 [Leifsonia aquatica ATCC 14665]MBB2968215.1 beta-fructofuranosidase [Leifsonia aquatica]
MSPFRRPLSAATAAAGDPIPFRIGEETHLFYLSSPAGTLDYPERVRTTWQHARSRDLVSWEELAPAVAPGDVGAYDGGGIWTGSIVENDGRYYLFYTGHHVGAPNPQTICLAVSDDLVNFTKYADNPVLLPTADYEQVDWRDPYVFFNEDEGLWWMLIATRLAEGPHWRRGAIALATSPDLMTWTVEEKPFYTPGDTYCPECPELWELDGRWYLVYSRFSEEVGTIYRVADRPRGPFRIPANESLGGRRWYASKSAAHPGGRAFFGWVHDRVTADGGPRWLWGGDFALPRIVRANAAGDLEVGLARGVIDEWPHETLRRDVALDGVGGNSEVRLGVLPDSAVIRATFTDATAAIVGLDLIVDDHAAGWRIELDRGRGRARLAAVPSPLDDFWADLTGRAGQYREVDGPILASAESLELGERVELVVVLDGEIVEIYLDGRVALTQRLDRTKPIELGAYALAGDSKVTVTVSTR